MGELDRRTFLAGTAALGAGGFLAACGSSGSSKAGGSSGTGTKATPGVSNATPKKGGTLNIGVEAEDQGLNPAVNTWDVTGFMYGAAFNDTIAAVGADNKVHPYLAQSITPNADYTQWTIKLRSTPIHFHDGTLCDASAVVGSLQFQVQSIQNGQQLLNVESVKNPDASTVVVTMKEPWSAFPYYLAYGAIGGVMAPAMLNSSDHGARHAIGTGPFVFSEWVPNDHLTVTRNPSYWQPGLPHLDKVVFHPIPDHQSRESSLKAGSIDIMHTDDTQTAVDFMHDPSFQYINDVNNVAGEHEQDFFMINCLQPPLNNVTVRQALAYSIDRQKVINTLYNGISPNSNGPFSKGSPYYLADTGYPEYNLAKAQSLMKQAEQQIGGPVKFELSIINDAKDLAVTQLVQAMFQAAGAQATLVQIQQAEYINQALLGHYGVRGWRQFSASDPDQNYVFWTSKAAGGIGQIALNFARNKDPEIDAALETGRKSGDPATRAEAYQTISKRFGADVPYLWLNQAYWSVIGKSNVMNFDNPVGPDGTKLLKMTSGYFDPRFIWLS